MIPASVCGVSKFLRCENACRTLHLPLYFSNLLSWNILSVILTVIVNPWSLQVGSGFIAGKDDVPSVVVDRAGQRRTCRLLLLHPADVKTCTLHTFAARSGLPLSPPITVATHGWLVKIELPRYWLGVDCGCL